jgi:coenzyme F420-0:L-glutamate ligase / coenzyme F420-1:gamma-L-glutamate ligase
VVIPKRAPLTTRELRVFALEKLPEVEEGDDLASLIAEAAERVGGLEEADVVVVAQKVVSKAEGRVVRLDDLEATERARALAGSERDARHVQVVLDETARIVRSRPPLLIAETRHGFVCASAGVDASNAKGPGTVVLLPLDPDASAARIRDGLRGRTGRDVGVVVSDSFGRPWRQGTTDVALGVAGIEALRDLRGVRDGAGYVLQGTQIAVADELAAAAELVLGKTSGCPAAVVRGLDVRGDGSGRDLVMPPERDLFR